MGPATITQVGAWFLVWTWTTPPTKGGPSYPVCLGSFQDEAAAQSLCDAFNDPANHLGSSPQPM